MEIVWGGRVEPDGRRHGERQAEFRGVTLAEIRATLEAPDRTVWQSTDCGRYFSNLRRGNLPWSPFPKTAKPLRSSPATGELMEVIHEPKADLLILRLRPHYEWGQDLEIADGKAVLVLDAQGNLAEVQVFEASRQGELVLSSCNLPAPASLPSLGTSAPDSHCSRRLLDGFGLYRRGAEKRENLCALCGEIGFPPFVLL